MSSSVGLKAITTVYSYRHPEARRVIDSVIKKGFPHGQFLRATEPTGGLDGFHDPVIDKVLNFYADDVPSMKTFSYRYPTSGSEEGIREIMTKLQYEGVQKFYVLEGEYEGYKTVGETRQMETVAVKEDVDPSSLKPGYWFISNPSARDGNIIPDDFIRRICDAGHQVFYDLAYMGSTAPHVYDLSHPNIFAAVISMSKPYGVFYDRIGFAFSRKPVSSLYGNKWFKSIFALMIADALVTQLQKGEIPAKYKPIQAEIIADINREYSLDLKPSDAFLLAYLKPEDTSHLSPSQVEMLAPFKRGNNYRLCLTRYFIERDTEAQQLLEDNACQ
ncbi:hypothetical protein A2230_08000 [candidate division WOR-1 bacterium RIFOXYA2_FULL_36_21]|uniref:Aminotransferase class I/classII large domain-containing protein n=1 Tax=candidate division WOR-1 bacterium RIFOXYB2_FULL_36_35 TaxID=1802578 RepID=A0A1F4S310_UNCSA|nr:MAG: hypothetical protein A2230_08000 [candidate division WOR-1 bacterium RIFOXYA2_FULL_36_21]OGC14800.1 MAG: hypothetical protein A2290_07875 [candidate division WOR-1 bacterium RIFOXYB2_FULL_36_35]OGC16568.1 MAG: hypothetical protein A2282_06415 [candidate division WOR-1 bacterium RIFOXYA12_FULL_36_13]